MSPRHAIVASALVMGAAILIFPQGATAQQGSPSSASPAAQSPSDAAAKSAFEALPEADRHAIQDALVWAGDYSGISDGNFGKGTLAAIKAYQVRAKVKPDGILAASTSTTLLAEATKAREATGFKITDDAMSGIRLGVPLRLLDQRAAGQSGSIFKAKDNSVSLVAFTEDASKVTLADLFSHLTTDTSKHITYKLLRPEFLVVAGKSGGKRFYSRIALGPQGLRGFTFSFPPQPSFDRISVAISNSFVPFPQAAQAQSPGSAPAPPTPAVAGPAQRAPVQLSAVALDARQILTVIPPAGCTPSIAGGRSTKVLRADASAGLALLERAGPEAQDATLRLRGAELQPNEAVLVLSSTGDGEANVSVASGEAPSPSRIRAPLQASSGSVVFDRSGALAGIVAFQANVKRLPTGIVPEASYAIISASTIRDFLASAKPPEETAPPGAAETSAGVIAAKYGRALLSVSCGG